MPTKCSVTFSSRGRLKPGHDLCPPVAEIGGRPSGWGNQWGSQTVGFGAGSARTAPDTRPLPTCTPTVSHEPLRTPRSALQAGGRGFESHRLHQAPPQVSGTMSRPGARAVAHRKRRRAIHGPQRRRHRAGAGVPAAPSSSSPWSSSSSDIWCNVPTARVQHNDDGGRRQGSRVTRCKQSVGCHLPPGRWGRCGTSGRGRACC